MAGSCPNRPLRTPGLLLRPVISLGDLLQLWHPTSHLHWGSRAMIRQSLHSPPHWGPQFLDPDIFRTESPSLTVRHETPSPQILKNVDVCLVFLFFPSFLFFSYFFSLLLLPFSLSFLLFLSIFRVETPKNSRFFPPLSGPSFSFSGDPPDLGPGLIRRRWLQVPKPETKLHPPGAA